MVISHIRSGFAIEQEEEEEEEEEEEVASLITETVYCSILTFILVLY